MNAVLPVGFWRVFARELLGFAPLIGLYLRLALQPGAFEPLQRTWLVGVQFPLIEVAAAALAAMTAFGLGRGLRVGRAGAERLASARERDLALIALGIATVVVLPLGAYGVLHDGTKALGIAGIFLPRALELWRIRDQSRPVARAVGFAAASGPALIGVLVLLALLLGAAAPRHGSHDPPTVPLLIAAYYVWVAACSAWATARAEPWRH
jgi:hypothetical protein